MPNAYDTRPLLMMSSTLISSASRTGSQNGMGTAASRIASCLVRAAIADARMSGDRQVAVLGAVMLGQHRDDRAAGLRPRAHVDGRGVQIGRRRARLGRTHVEPEGEHQRIIPTPVVTPNDLT